MRVVVGLGLVVGDGRRLARLLLPQEGQGGLDAQLLAEGGGIEPLEKQDVLPFLLVGVAQPRLVVGRLHDLLLGLEASSLGLLEEQLAAHVPLEGLPQRPRARRHGVRGLLHDRLGERKDVLQGHGLAVDARHHLGQRARKGAPGVGRRARGGRGPPRAGRRSGARDRGRRWGPRGGRRSRTPTLGVPGPQVKSGRASALRPATIASMFSARTRFDLTPNRLARRSRSAERAGKPVLDLTLSNPTAADLPYPGRPPAAPGRSRGAPLRSLPAGLPRRPARRWPRTSRAGGSGSGRTTSSSPRARARPTPSSSSCCATRETRCWCPVPGYPLFDYLAALEGVRPVSYSLAFDGEWHIDLAAPARAASLRAPGPWWW